MSSVLKKILKIILIHLLWLFYILIVALSNESFNHIISSVSFFLIEPINLFVIYPALVYVLIYKIIQKEPYCIKNERRTLVIFSVICTLLFMGWIIRNHIEIYVEYGFEILLYREHWLY